MITVVLIFFFFFNDTATTEIYTLSLHDALPICCLAGAGRAGDEQHAVRFVDELVHLFQRALRHAELFQARSEEHTSELQSQSNLVCRLLLEKKKQKVKFLPCARYELTRNRLSRL